MNVCALKAFADLKGLASVFCNAVYTSICISMACRYIHVHKYICTHKHICIYLSLSLYIYRYAHQQTHAHTQFFTCIHACTHMYTQYQTYTPMYRSTGLSSRSRPREGTDKKARPTSSRYTLIYIHINIYASMYI